MLSLALTTDTIRVFWFTNVNNTYIMTELDRNICMSSMLLGQKYGKAFFR